MMAANVGIVNSFAVGAPINGAEFDSSNVTTWQGLRRVRSSSGYLLWEIFL